MLFGILYICTYYALLHVEFDDLESERYYTFSISCMNCR